MSFVLAAAGFGGRPPTELTDRRYARLPATISQWAIVTQLLTVVNVSFRDSKRKGRRG